MKASSATVTSVKRPVVRRVSPAINKYAAYTPLSFALVDQQAKNFADMIESHFEELTDILLEYESYEVVQDETARTLDLLRNLKENSKYFQLRVNEITAFLPRNQPLYAFACFVAVPSLMASSVHFRIPHNMRNFFPKMLELLDVKRLFPNVVVSDKTRLEFLRERSALRVDAATHESVPVSDAVIFTGTSIHASQLRLIFDNRTLFISNGSGHNPVVVSKDADLPAAVDAVLTLQLYNQGQDCAAPNAILVHKDVHADFLKQLRSGLRAVRVGQYRDRSCRIGPISEPRDLVRIQDFLIHNRRWLDPSTPGVIRAHDAIVEPTIVNKPLKSGANFTEIFAPVVFLQEYEEDSQLASYFEDPQYAQNAMYISLYGTSKYVSSLIDRPIAEKVLHDNASILIDSHLHEKGVERGTQTYGGYGYGASSLSVNGKLICKPTLPQRDIYEWVARPLQQNKSLAEYRKNVSGYTKIMEKNIEKLLRLSSQEAPAQSETAAGRTYIDMQTIKKSKDRRYADVDERHTYHLLDRPNIECIAKLKCDEIVLIRSLRKLLVKRAKMSLDEFNTALYGLAATARTSEKENRARQLDFFQLVYQLLLNKRSGPRLGQFLSDLDITKVRELLDV